MKSKKNNKSQKGKISRNNGNTKRGYEKYTFVEQMQFAREDVIKEFSLNLQTYKKKYPTTNASDILYEMMQTPYINSFPILVRPIVKKTLAEVATKEIREALEILVYNAVFEGKISKQRAIEKIKSSNNFVEKLFDGRTIPESFKEKIQSAIDEYVADCEIQLFRGIAPKEEFDFENSYSETVEEELVTEKVEPEITAEEKFVESIANYTEGYKFLAEDPYTYRAMNGNTNSYKKFDDVETMARFSKVQDIVKNISSKRYGREEVALRHIINDLGNLENPESNTVVRNMLAEEFVNLELKEEDKEFMTKVLKPICEARLSVLEKELGLDSIEER